MIDEFRNEYMAEARQVLKSMEQSLLELEKNASPDEVNNVYRYLHTLKGSAGMFGYRKIETLAHELETAYSDIREGIRQPDSSLLDITLHAVDVFADLLEGHDADQEVETILSSLGSEQASGATGTGVLPVDVNECFAVLLRPEKEIFKRGINLPAILEELQELGTTEIIVHHETVPLEKQLADKSIVSWLEIILVTTKGIDAVRDVFLFMKPGEYSVLSISGIESFSTPEYKQQVELNAKELDLRSSILNKLMPALSTPTAAEIPAAAVPASTEEPEAAEDLDERITTNRKSRHEGHINVAAQKLDHLINIVSELVIFRSEMSHLLETSQNPAVEEALEKLERLTLNLRDSAFNIRLVPLSVLNVKLQRLIRGVSRELGKEVEFITEGLTTELDRSMISTLEAPLIHLIRNAIDHGIETPEERRKRNKPEKGLLKLYSYNSGDHVFIQLQDDGNGIDFDKIRAKGIERGLLSRNQQYSEKELINLMMSPGFSTADKVTTVSGRGVGMDVVKRDILSMRGDIEVSTEKGLGSIFTLRLPLTLTVLDTLVVEVGENKYLIPVNEVEHCYTEKHEELFRKKSRQITYDGQLTPFVSLREHFNMNEFKNEETVIVVNKNDTRVAVVVDKIIGKLQTVYKPLNELLHPADCFSGASILGDGSMALILNALKLKN